MDGCYYSRILRQHGQYLVTGPIRTQKVVKAWLLGKNHRATYCFSITQRKPLARWMLGSGWLKNCPPVRRPTVDQSSTARDEWCSEMFEIRSLMYDSSRRIVTKASATHSTTKETTDGYPSDIANCSLPLLAQADEKIKTPEKQDCLRKKV